MKKMTVKDFLVNSDDTGRFIIKSLKTGRTYYIEPIDGGEKVDWGDLNPATKKIEGDYGSKHNTWERQIKNETSRYN